MIWNRGLIRNALASRWLWVFCVLFCIAAFAYSISDLINDAGIDLRNRVVGARALLLSLDPYSIDWRPGMPLDLADTHQRYPGVTRVTAAPSCLLMYIPFAELSYRMQHLIWWVLQWMALAAAILVLARSFSDRFERNVFTLIAIVCFASSWFWRLHVERGQYYIFVVLLVCLDLAVLRQSRRCPGWLGIPSGIAVAIKPTNVLLLPALWFMGERRAALTGCLAAAIVFAASVYPSGPVVWWSFLSAVSDNAEAEIDYTFENRHFGPVQGVAPDIIESMNFRYSISTGWRDDVPPSTLTSFFKARWTVYLNQGAMLFLFIAGPIAVWWLNRINASRDELLLFISLLLAIVDFFRPWRYSYVDVNFLPVTAFIITLLLRSRALIILACITYMGYLAPLEKHWVVPTRYALTITLASAIIVMRLSQKPPALTPRRLSLPTHTAEI
jgi:hypothetical protein